MSICKGCGDPIKNLRNKLFCSKQCYRPKRQVGRVCSICFGPMSKRNKEFCSKKCMGESKKNLIMKKYECKRCGEIYYRGSGLKPTTFCSKRCRSMVYNINHLYFSDITNDKIIMIGRLIVIGYIRDYRTIILQSSKEVLDDISKILDSDYEIVKSDRGLYRVTITSERMVSSLIGILCNDPMYQELPPYDFDLLISGIRQTHCYKDGIYTLNSSRVASELADRLGMRMRDRLYKDMSIGRTACEYLVY